MSDDMRVMEWKDPPPAKNIYDRAGYEVLAAELKANPKRWALIRSGLSITQAGNAAGKLRDSMVFRPAGEWQFVSRSGSVYGRYLGGPGD